MKIFDGNVFAEKKERELKERAAMLREQGKQPRVAAILFVEDAGSQLYTQLKKQAAERVGMQYEVHAFSMLDEREKIAAEVQQLNVDEQITGIIIQKPTRQKWMDVTAKSREDFSQWWHELVSHIDEKKDVDGLHPQTLASIQQGTWREQGKVLPATVKAVLSILESAGVFAEKNALKKIIILGKSDILGQPLFYELKNRGQDVEMIGSKELEQRAAEKRFLQDADVIVSSTGRPNLITGEMIREGVVVIDVGEPKGDVNGETVSQKAAFLTPVPGGVGPVTVVSLLENAIELFQIK